MFTARNLVRMHDIDMVGILYFPRQFRFVHETMEDFLEKEGVGFNSILKEKSFLFVIVHCEADYLAPLKLGDPLEIRMSVEHIGTSSFTFNYEIYKGKDQKVGNAKTVHVSIDFNTRTKVPIPPSMRKVLQKHLV